MMPVMERSQVERAMAQSLSGGMTAEHKLEVGFPINARGAVDLGFSDSKCIEFGIFG